MRIAYITTSDPNDIHGWSGLTFNIARSLKSAGNQLEFIHSFKTNIPFSIKIKQKLYPKLTGKFLQPNRYPAVYNQYTSQIEAGLKELGTIDLLFSNSSEIIAAAPGNIPKAFWVDANFAAMLGYYPEFSRLHPETLKKANALEQQAYDKASFIFFASDWAAETAKRYYRIDGSKITVVPFGANLTEELAPQEIESLINKRSFGVCNLLFSGVDWERKGGPIAVKVVEALNEQGINAKLTVTGCKPFSNENVPAFVTQVGFLSKKDETQKKQYEDLFHQAHFLLVPTIAECYGLVYCEANAYGVPAIAGKTGGVTTIIKDDINGKTFSKDAKIEEYTTFIKKYFNSDTYKQLALNAYSEYKNRLNWAVAGQKVTEIIQSELKIS